MATKKKERNVPLGGLGSSGDIKDRFRGAYKPGANPPPKPGLMSPMDAIRKMRKKKPAAK